MFCSINNNINNQSQTNLTILTRKTILWISDFDNTGYTTVTKKNLEILLKYPHKYDIHLLVINRYCERSTIIQFVQTQLPQMLADNIHTITYDKTLDKPSNMYDNNDVRDFFFETLKGINEIPNIINKIKPDIILTINDWQILIEHVNTIRSITKWNGYLITYIFIDCRSFYKGFFDFAKQVDTIWTSTEFSKCEILKDSNFNEALCPIKVIPHVIDINKFYKLPIESRELLRKKWLHSSITNDDFIILNCNVNQDRKRLDLTMIAFWKLYKKIKTDNNTSINTPVNIYLVLKTSKDASIILGGIDIQQYCKYLNEKYQIDLTNKLFLITQRLSLIELNEVYNCCDVSINTSSGEGWGLVPCEVSLCKIPQLVPNNTSYPEIFSNNQLIKTNPFLYLVGRVSNPLKNELNADILNKYNNEYMISSIYKSYRSALYNGTTIVKGIKIDKNIPTILLANIGIDRMTSDLTDIDTYLYSYKKVFDSLNINIIKCFRTLSYALKWMDMNELPERIQILTIDNYNFTYIGEIYEQILTENLWLNKEIIKLRKTLIIEPDDIKSLLFSQNIMVDIIDTDDLVDKFINYINDPRKKEYDGQQCYDLISTKYSENKIEEILIPLFDNF
jgi:hypothetical protein